MLRNKIALKSFLKQFFYSQQWTAIEVYIYKINKHRKTLKSYMIF